MEPSGCLPATTSSAYPSSGPWFSTHGHSAFVPEGQLPLFYNAQHIFCERCTHYHNSVSVGGCPASATHTRALNMADGEWWHFFAGLESPTWQMSSSINDQTASSTGFNSSPVPATTTGTEDIEPSFSYNAWSPLATGYDMGFTADSSPQANSLDGPAPHQAALYQQTQAQTMSPFLGCRCPCHPHCYATPSSAQPWQGAVLGQPQAFPYNSALRESLYTWAAAGSATPRFQPACLTLGWPEMPSEEQAAPARVIAVSDDENEQDIASQHCQPESVHMTTEPAHSITANQGVSNIAVTSQQGARTALPSSREPRKRSRAKQTRSPRPLRPRIQGSNDPSTSQPQTPTVRRQLIPNSQRPNVDEVVYKGRREGMTYAEIKRTWRLPQSESTLRGRYLKIKRRFDSASP